jgi:hypothetical protein
LTSRFTPAYRSSVTRGRRVPHVHVSAVALPPANRERTGSAWAGGAGRNRWTGFDQRRPTHRAIWPKPRRDSSLIPSERTREQAYVPAEQPPPPQGARIPAAHAHPRGPVDPFRASPQGAQEPGRLSRGSSGPPCPRVRAPGPASPHSGRRRAPRVTFRTSQPQRHAGAAPAHPRTQRRQRRAGTAARGLRGGADRRSLGPPSPRPTPASPPVPGPTRRSAAWEQAGRPRAGPGRARDVPGTRCRSRPLSPAGAG